jgi:hypothetical protein
LPWLDWGFTGIPWLTLDHRDAQYEYAQRIHQWFSELEASLPGEIARRIAEAHAGFGSDPAERGAVWTYLMTDQPFGSWTQRALRGIRRKSSA